MQHTHDEAVQSGQAESQGQDQAQDAKRAHVKYLFARDGFV